MWRVRGGGDCKPEDKEAAENFVLRWVGENLEEVSLRNIMNWLSMVIGCEGKREKKKGLWSDAWVFGWGQHS